MKSTVNIALYGAGRLALQAKEHIDAKGGAVCFIDADPLKQGKELAGLPVLSLDDARKIYPQLNFHVTTDEKTKYKIFDYLTDQGIEKECILNYEEFYRGCTQLESQMAIYDEGLYYCCEQYHLSTPCAAFDGNIDNTISKWLDVRDETIMSLKTGKRSACEDCRFISNGYFPAKKQITNIAFGLHAPCQLACKYCIIYNKKRKKENYLDLKKCTIKSFDFPLILTRLEERNLIAKDAYISLTSGEITIDPARNKILDAVAGYRGLVSTNALIFNEQVASVTSRAGGSLLVSVDAGTPGTYMLIKGADAFDNVWANIRKYVKCGSNVTAKYIFLKQNTNDADIEGFIRYCVETGINSIICASDISRQFPIDGEQFLTAVKMIKLAKSHGIPVSVPRFYCPDDETMEKLLSLSS